ncbi:PH-like domain-containing protein [Streptomyces mayteni]
MNAALFHPLRIALTTEEGTETVRRSQEVTDWGARVAWVVGLLLFVALVYWLMREGWKWRATLQGDLPELPAPPAEPGPARLRMAGRYHGSTTAGQWLDRIAAHGLGARSRAVLTLTEEGVTVVRPGAGDFLIPADRIRGARPEKGIAGKVLTEGGLLVITWQHGERLLDSGFRADRSAEHARWIEILGTYTPGQEDESAAAAETAPAPHDPRHDKEGVR